MLEGVGVGGGAGSAQSSAGMLVVVTGVVGINAGAAGDSTGFGGVGLKNFDREKDGDVGESVGVMVCCGIVVVVVAGRSDVGLKCGAMAEKTGVFVEFLWLMLL